MSSRLLSIAAAVFMVVSYPVLVFVIYTSVSCWHDCNHDRLMLRAIPC